MLRRVTSRAVCRPHFDVVGIFLLLLIFFACMGESPADALVASPSSEDHRLNRTTAAVEILSISGCRRPSRPGRSRETYRCFADKTSSKKPVMLTIRGRGFPLDTSIMVLLREHAVIPLRCGDGKNECDLIQMECVKVRRSEIFPQQILSCALPHPSKELHDKPRWLKRLAQGPMWMDVKLQLVKSKNNNNNNETDAESQERVTIGVLSHAVQLSLAEDTSNAGRNHSHFDEKLEDPLERLFQNKDGSLDVHSQWLALGIGGLKEQLHSLYRRVFLSRLSSTRSVVEALNLPHVRGVILHGPPGNGKTLIARTIANLLDGSAKVTIVNGADILSKYVGDSEKNLRKLFANAMDDAADNDDGNDDDDSNNDVGKKHDGIGKRTQGGQLHTIIIDEIESLFRRRGESGDENSAKAVYDGLTNQLLTLMDGLEGAGNILVIGLTNQLHVIDRALLRPGRFEVVIEIPLPDVEGRREMLFIHTRALREGNHLAAGVDLALLATRTGGFSGADVAGMVRAASSHALIRYRDALWKPSTETISSGAAEDTRNTAQQFQVTNEDFELALQDISEAKSQTRSGTQLGEGYASSGESNSSIVDYDGSFNRNKEASRRVLQSLLRSRVAGAAVIIIYGPPGTGKTTLVRELLRIGSLDPITQMKGSVLHSDPMRNPLDEVITILRSALHTKGNSSIVIENVDHYLRNGGPLAGDILKNALQEFGAATSSQTTSRVYGTTETTSSYGKRLLIMTVSDKDVLNELTHITQYDLLLSLRLLQRKDIMPLLHHYAIISSNIKTAEEVVRAYPPQLSYRQFLRITDLALWRAHDAQQQATTGAAGGQEDAALFSRVNAFFLQAGHSSVKSENVPSLNTKEQLKKFSAAVREIVSAMGFSDTFQDLLPVQDTVDGEEISW